jgi:hypothetical protein
MVWMKLYQQESLLSATLQKKVAMTQNRMTIKRMETRVTVIKPELHRCVGV